MITELKKHEFYKCKHMIIIQGHMEVKAIIEGINPGRIFVDNTEYPTSGLIWLGNNDGFFFIGNEENQEFNRGLNDFFYRVIEPEAKKVGLHWFEGVGHHPNWNKRINKIFQHRKIGSWNQKVYMLQESDYKQANEPAIAQGYTILKINKSLYENSIHNLDFINAKILGFWSSLDDFFDYGIGFVAVYQNQIISSCFSGFVAEGTHNIDIETLEEHQGKKLAQKLAHTFVKECFRKGMIPYWDCMEGNKPSIAVAENIGFSNVFNYVGYEFPFQ